MRQSENRAVKAVVHLFYNLVVFLVIVGIGRLLFSLGGCASMLPEHYNTPVRYSKLKLCETPALVYAIKGTPRYQAEFLRRGFEYWNVETGLPLFVWGGVLSTPYYVPAKSMRNGVIEHRSVVLVGYSATLPPHVSGLYQPTDVPSCVAGAMIQVDSMLKLFPGQVDAVVRHEAGHALGLAHAAPNGIMYEEMIFTMESNRKMKSVPYASSAEVVAVRSMYAEEKR